MGSLVLQHGSCAMLGWPPPLRSGCLPLAWSNGHSKNQDINANCCWRIHSAQNLHGCRHFRMEGDASAVGLRQMQEAEDMAKSLWRRQARLDSYSMCRRMLYRRQLLYARPASCAVSFSTCGLCRRRPALPCSSLRASGLRLGGAFLSGSMGGKAGWSAHGTFREKTRGRP